MACLSKYLQKEVKKIEIKSIFIGKSLCYVKFTNSESTLIINLRSGHLRCDCINGSLYGINNKQICKHKVRFVKELFENG